MIAAKGSFSGYARMIAFAIPIKKLTGLNSDPVHVVELWRIARTGQAFDPIPRLTVPMAAIRADVLDPGNFCAHRSVLAFFILVVFPIPAQIALCG